MKIRPADWLKVAVLLLIFVGGLLIGFQILKPDYQLPIYNPSDLDPRLVDAELQGRGLNHRTLDFALVNQYGDTISQVSTKNKIYVADFFFTTCPGICKDMAVQKRRLQSALADDSLFMILSHTVTPESDSVPVISEYAEAQGAIKGKWHILTGDKPQIYALARRSYFSVIDEGGAGDEADFIHTENFVLIDTKRRIRGYYDGTSEEDVNRLLDDYEYLRQETLNALAN